MAGISLRYKAVSSNLIHGDPETGRLMLSDEARLLCTAKKARPDVPPDSPEQTAVRRFAQKEKMPAGNLKMEDWQ